MRGITIISDDKIGILADLSYVLGKERVNIENISAHAVGDKVVIYLTVNDYNKALEVLKKNGFNVLVEKEIIIKLVDKPGQLSKITQILKEAKINIKNIYIVSRDGKETLVGLITDKPRKTKEVLKEYLIYNQ